jgi:hypothetical protein
MQIAIATQLNKAEPLLHPKFNLTSFVWVSKGKTNSFALLIRRQGGRGKTKCSIGVVCVGGGPIHS